MTDTVKEQILAIRATGVANMFDVYAVQRLVFERDFFELVYYIEDDRAGYVHFILTGE
ncbi:DUF5049 domain-containing protein [Selenomonas ruminantium]|uniref:DUF5049 domain-containing protein n=1 Tax=Selenomonas ruminantium TaxID=971 RepID=A0A1I0X5M2_SELRU|nr:DUF5049 domain-containing protein [Selenomonas ruminantium]SFA96124.1 protein of unknown function [Selenomonas ruminantium]